MTNPASPADSGPAPDDDLGLADLAPVEPPDGVFERLVDVALDPSTPDPGGDLVPDAGTGTDGVDLDDFDDDGVLDEGPDPEEIPDTDPHPTHDSGTEDDDPADDLTDGDPLAHPLDPDLAGLGFDPSHPSQDAEVPDRYADGYDGAGADGDDDADAGTGPGGYDDLDQGV